MTRKPTGLDWSAIRTNYVAAGGRPEPSVWRSPSSRVGVSRPGIGGRPRREADRTDHQIRARYDAGASMPELVREYGMAKTSVRNAILRAGGEFRSRKDASRLAKSVKLTEAQEIEVLRRYDAGEASTDLAEVYGASPRTIRRVITERGGTIRNASEAQKLNAAKRNNNRENKNV